jgi:hypothetical protein
MDIPRPKVHDLNVIIRALITEKFEGLSLILAELSTQEALGEIIDHAVLHL